MKTWNLDEATAGLTELMRRALAHQPQRVDLGGHDAVVVMNAKDFATLAFARDLVDFVRKNAYPAAHRSTPIEDNVSGELAADAASSLENP